MKVSGTILGNVQMRRLLNWFHRLSGPYVYVVLVEIKAPDYEWDIVWGVFGTEKKAKDAIEAWKLEEHGIYPVILQPFVIDYRTLTAPARYWRNDDAKEP